MDTIKFLEQTASKAHHKLDIKQALLEQPATIQQAVNFNNNDLIRNHLDSTEVFPDTCTVIY